MAADDLAAGLDRIADRAALAYASPARCAESQADVPALLKALGAVLELHRPGRIAIHGALCKGHENHRYFSITRTEADDVRACPDCEATVYTLCTGCGPQASMEACPVRLAITRELTGKGTGDGA